MRVPFVLQQLLSWFHRQLRAILQAAVCDNASSFIDDILILSFGRVKHCEDVRKVLNALTSAKLTINLAKFVFGAVRLKLLGLVIDGRGVTVDRNHVLIMMEWDHPKTKKQLQKLLGWLNYSRRFITHYAEKTAIYYNMLSSKGSFSWTDEHEKQYVELYQELSSGKCSTIGIHLVNWK